MDAPIEGESNRFQWRASFTKVLSHRYKQFAEDEEEDRLRSLDFFDWRNKLSTSLEWSLRNWTSTLQVNRYGRIPNAASTDNLTPTTLANVSVDYSVNSAASIALIGNNVFDTIKEDPSNGWPFYPVGNFLPYGREAWVEFSYHFGT